MEVLVGRIYRHFKGDYYLVENIATDANTNKKVVVYRGLYGNGPLWVREIEDFTAKLDKQKYSSATQVHRFELQNINSVVNH